MSGAWTIHTQVFDGPLDLLLYLVQKKGLNPRELSMVEIADSYLAYLARMTELHLGLAADYLVMASTLIWLKSLELLPRKPALVEEEDPAEALADQLIAYQEVKAQAAALDALPRLGREQHRREAMEEGEGPLVSPVDAFGLLELYYAMLQRHAEPPPTHQVHGPMPTLEDACREVIGLLDLSGGSAELGWMLRELGAQRERVLGFLGVLEMTRLRWLSLEQRVHLGPVQVSLNLDGDPDYGLLSGAVEEEIA
ncbi:MAG: segregation/condensation protein A [Deltaproteobacteria bacterium]|nr:segregation/condensation protein A [Deltaproteobacteria bacterium]